ncbi:MAG: hypothetical protein PVF22_02070 [Candidatus Aminicenantes bacterium]|jgi:hypothetical protein
MDRRSHYFQTIARRFFELRGAPLFLSSRELMLIEKWEAAGIPLRVVLEGIQSSFAARRKKPGQRTKVLSLAFCQPQVKKAFAMYRERKVGRREMAAAERDKKKDIESAVNQFLEGVPEQVSWLEAPFGRVREMLPVCSEEELEKAEDEIEALLVTKASPEVKAKVSKDVSADFPEADRKEFLRISKIKLIKHMRDKYRIPHVALYYY